MADSGFDFADGVSSATPGSKRFAGMTLGERLYVAKLFNKWQRAGARRDRAKMIELLSQVTDAEFRVEDAPGIVDVILADPGKFGF